MPIIEITLIEGRSRELKAKMMTEVTNVMVSTLGAKRESVRIILREIPAYHFAAGGVVFGEPKEKSD
jgi:4-oxalocrotonate tautomerase